MRVVETGSFSAVARELGTGQPNVSRHIAALENALGARLLVRSTRRMATTPEGERYYLQARRALDLIAQAEAAAGEKDEPHGLLRVTCAERLGTDVLLPALPAFLDRYPRIQLEFRLSDHCIDLVAEGIDVAIRSGALKDSSLRAKRIATSERLYMASARYLRKHGVPELPEDLERHESILYTLLADGQTSWPFRNANYPVNGRLRLNNLDAVRHAMLQDLGIAYLPTWMAAQHLATGEVRVVLASHTAPEAPLHALSVADRHLPRIAAAFIDFIGELFARVPGLDGTPLAAASGPSVP